MSAQRSSARDFKALAGLLQCPFCRAQGMALLEPGHTCVSEPFLAGGRVLNFAQGDNHWNHISQKEMSLLIAKAGSLGWCAALQEELRPRVDRYTYQYALDERRGDFFGLCSLRPGSVILELGAGWGPVSVALARLGGLVISTDMNSQTLKFLALRAEQEGLANLYCLHVDPLETARVPLREATVDLVVINGVLEWVGSQAKEGDPADLQQRAIKEACRVLKQGGELYLAIESRFGLSYWLGGQDHSQLSFTSLMPRRLASWYMQARNKGPYRTYTHDWRALSRMLAKAGFSASRFFEPFPDYRFPERIIPLDDSRAFRRCLGHMGLSRKHVLVKQVLSLGGLHRLLADNYAVVAKK